MGPVDRLLDRLAMVQHRRAGAIALLGLLLAAAAVPLVGRLGLDSSWTSLLPRDKPSVRDLEKIGNRVGGLSSLSVAIESPGHHLEAMQHFARDLVPRLETLEKTEKVRSVDWNIATYEQFVAKHHYLYAKRSDLREVRDALQKRLDWERARRNPFYVDLDDQPPPKPDQLLERLRGRQKSARDKLARYPGGFYVSRQHDLLFVFLRTDIGGGDAAGAARLIGAVERQVHALGPKHYAPDLKVELAGDLVVAREEHDAIARELVIATTLTIGGVLLAIFVFFRRMRAIPLLGLSLAVPVLLTFAFAYFAVGALNTSTAFLGSIVVGNGINPNIMWLARYFEERRRGVTGYEALRATHRGTWAATLTASLAAAIAYASLTITDFRGFRDFGIIGGVGMVLCWLGAYLLLPAATTLGERLRPLRLAAKETHGTVYGLLFSRLVHRWPRAIVVVSSLVTVIAIVLVAQAVTANPLEYNFSHLKSVRHTSTRAQNLNTRVSEIVGNSAAGQAIAIVVPHRSDVAPIVAQLARRHARGGAPFDDVRTIDDLLPKHQGDKLSLLADIRHDLLELRPYANGRQQKAIDENLPPAHPARVGMADLPEAVARPFTERDGTRGRILFVERKKTGVSIWDGRYLIAWAKALRKVRLPNGKRPPLAGTAPVFADMIEVIVQDGPKAILASFLATLALVLFTFRRGRERLLTMTALLLGITWMAGTMAAFGMKLNFLNFVAFPITFGNGVDYGVNVMRRYALEQRAGGTNPVGAAIEETGGAVILCSLTTIIGYLSLYTSANLALNSFGEAMGISELTCVAAAVLSMPAILKWLERKGPRGSTVPASAG